MDYLVSEMLAYYHEERPHQAEGNDPLTAIPSKPKKPGRKKTASLPEVISVSKVVCRERLGGL